MNRRFDFLTALVSFAASAAVLCGTVYLCVLSADVSWVLCALATGVSLCLAALAGFGAMHLLNLLRRKTKLNLPSLLSKTTLLALALLFVLGAAGQALFSFRVREQTLRPAQDSFTCDIALLVDASDSMNRRADERNAAAASLIEATTEDHKMSLGLFTAQIEAEEPLTAMDDKAKAAYNDVLKNAPQKGGTSLTKALEWAVDSLKESEADKQIVIVITDGSSPVYPDTAERLTKSGAELYSVRLPGSDEKFTDDFLALVNATGGFDTVLTDVTDKAELDPLVSAFCGLTSDIIGRTETKFGFAPFPILYTSPFVVAEGVLPLVLRLLVQFVFFCLYYLLMQLLLFRRITLPSILIGAGCAVLAVAAVSLSAGVGIGIICVLALALTMHTAFAFIESRY